MSDPGRICSTAFLPADNHSNSTFPQLGDGGKGQGVVLRNLARPGLLKRSSPQELHTVGFVLFDTPVRNYP